MIKEISQKPVYINYLKKQFVYEFYLPFRTIKCFKLDKAFINPHISFTAFLMLRRNNNETHVFPV